MHSEGLAGKTETFVRYGFTPRFEAGFGYLWKQGIVRPLASYVLITEKARLPSLTAGLMYDSLGRGRQGIFLSAAKDLSKALGIPSSFYLGGAKVNNWNEPRFIAGGSAAPTAWSNLSIQYDGRYANLGLALRIGRFHGGVVHLGVVAAHGDRFGPLLAIETRL